MRQLRFDIKGIHCAGCKTLIETELQEMPGIKNVTVNYRTAECILEFDEKTVSQADIAARLKKINYTPVFDKTEANKRNVIGYVSMVFIIAIIFGSLYFLISRFGWFEIMARLNDKQIGYPLIFLIGLIASFHCVGMCGGIVAAYSAKYSATAENKSLRPHWQYNMGRIISYTLIGGVLGGIGSLFKFSVVLSNLVLIVAGLFMVIIGLSLVFKFNLIKLTLPSGLAKLIFKANKSKRAPIVIGLLNGLMPCAPLQAMQFYALSTSNPLSGAASMFLFALGTAPVMFGLGSIITLLGHERIKNFLKLSGAIVIILGLVMINRGLTSYGLGINTITTATDNANGELKTGTNRNNEPDIQTVQMSVSAQGYDPDILYIKKGQPVKWIINGNYNMGCANEIILHGYNIDKKLGSGENVIEFTPRETGEIKFSCGMQMVWGKFIVTDNSQTSRTPTLNEAKNAIPNISSNANSQPVCNLNECENNN